MKKLVALAAVFSLFIFFNSVPPSHAEERGASPKAFEHASDQSIFNRVNDWFATVGKSDDEKRMIRAERKAKRAAKRMEKEARKAGKKTEKKAEELMKKVKETKMPWE